MAAERNSYRQKDLIHKHLNHQRIASRTSRFSSCFTSRPISQAHRFRATGPRIILLGGHSNVLNSRKAHMRKMCSSPTAVRFQCSFPPGRPSMEYLPPRVNLVNLLATHYSHSRPELRRQISEKPPKINNEPVDSDNKVVVKPRRKERSSGRMGERTRNRQFERTKIQKSTKL